MSAIINGNNLNALVQIMRLDGSTYFSGQHSNNDYEFNESELTEL